MPKPKAKRSRGASTRNCPHGRLPNRPAVSSPSPNTSVADLSLGQLMDAVGQRVQLEMQAYSSSQDRPSDTVDLPASGGENSPSIGFPCGTIGPTGSASNSTSSTSSTSIRYSDESYSDVGSNLTFQSPIPTDHADHRGNGCLTREFNVDVPVTPFSAAPTTSAYETREGLFNDVGMTIDTEGISSVEESSSSAAFGTSSNPMVTGRSPLMVTGRSPPMVTPPTVSPTVIQRGTTVVVEKTENGERQFLGLDGNPVVYEKSSVPVESTSPPVALACST